jgi:uncharacterized membrane protein YgdD (TMEM256/DUF423 family)
VSDTAPDSKSAGRTQRRIDIVSTVLLSVATLATAWAAYQSSRWHSEQAKLQAKATATRIESTRSQDVADREAQVDVALFFQWVDAHSQGDSQLADFYRARFTDRLAPAFSAWIATKPFTNPKAPSSPFAMAEYTVASNEDAAAQNAAADAASAQATEDIQRADNYVLAVVLFAACLFFAGVSTRMRTVTGQGVVLTFGCVLFVGTVVWIATLPVTVTL